MVNRFAPKLTFALRCFIYVSHHVDGTPYPLLSKTFDVNVETIGLICRRNSRVYMNVRAEADRMGIETMYKQYARPELLARVEKARMGETNTHIDRGIVPSGPGKYYVSNHNGDRVMLDIMPYELIKDQTEPVAPEFQRGFYYKDPELGWTFDDEPFRFVEEALRHFAEFPPRWEK